MRIEKEDVLAYLQAQDAGPQSGLTNSGLPKVGRTLASPKARRLARERGLDLTSLRGSGPEGAVLAADVLNAVESVLDAAPAGLRRAFRRGAAWHNQRSWPKADVSWTGAAAICEGECQPLIV
jgi:pyruvate dehydrogenase E2 component (dihydrolipoamide acetyltransferase)